MSVEASTDVLNARPSFGAVPVVGTVSPEMFEAALDVHAEHAPRRNRLPYHAMRIGATTTDQGLMRLYESVESGSIDQTQLEQDLRLCFDAEPQRNETTEQLAALKILAASREFFDMAHEDRSAVPGDTPLTIQANLFSNYDAYCEFGLGGSVTLWHIDAIARNIRRVKYGLVWLTSSPTTTRISTSQALQHLDILPLLGSSTKPAGLEDIRAFDAAVKEVIDPGDVYVPQSGEVNRIDPFRPHHAPFDNEGGSTRCVLRVSA